MPLEARRPSGGPAGFCSISSRPYELSLLFARAATAIDGGVGDAQHAGRLVDRQAAEEPKLDHLAQPSLLLAEAVHGIIQGHEVDRLAPGGRNRLVQRDPLRGAPLPPPRLAA